MVFSSRVFFWDGVLYWSSNNSISEIGFPDCRSQFVLSKKPCQNKKATRKGGSDSDFLSYKTYWSAAALGCGTLLQK